MHSQVKRDVVMIPESLPRDAGEGSGGGIFGFTRQLASMLARHLSR